VATRARRVFADPVVRSDRRKIEPERESLVHEFCFVAREHAHRTLHEITVAASALFLAVALSRLLNRHRCR